ncbi:MAG: hypothetical protein U1C04_17565 [Hydrogenophaga sp.]|uniref:hypothetical protein n=1 Tax=Hydrogenophaga sp. TaxID=1904254 RepID=UPI002ABBA848|nr:hypothetical protein [Hydrogenophaga sp.]MDZ4282560.1 hypothetical protein [Hydrogenophaga sp.]
MNDKTTPASNPPETVTPQAASGLSRRRLVRAGLTAAPVVAALHSNTVLAGGDHSCIRPSSFSSLKLANMKVSRGREIRADFECKSHGYWKNNQGNLTADYKKKTRFLSSETGFKANPGNGFKNKSLQDVLEMGGNANNAALARHVVAAFLSATSVRNSPDRVLLTVAQCQAIWNGQGNWSPFAGATWTLNDTMNYFDKVFGSAFL